MSSTNNEGSEVAPGTTYRSAAEYGRTPPSVETLAAMKLGDSIEQDSGNRNNPVVVTRIPMNGTDRWLVRLRRGPSTLAQNPKTARQHFVRRMRLAREAAVSERTAAATATFRPDLTSVLLRCTANQSGLGVGVPVEIVGVDPSDHGDPVRTMVTVRLPWGEEDKFQARDLCNQDLSPLALDRLTRHFAQVGNREDL